MTMGTVERATGRWREILPQLGIKTRFLVNRHGPCPLCGGKDRFRWDDRDGTGSYYCNQCGPGPGILLVRKLRGWDHATACRAIDEIIGRDPPPQREPEQLSRRREKSAEHLLAEAADHTIVRRYLTSRGLHTFPNVLLGHRRLAYLEDGRFIGHLPAMLAPVVGPDGELRSVHRTYLGAVPGKRKKLLSTVGTGAAIRLFEPTDQLGIAEGIETAIAAHELFGVPTWATISASIMEGFEPPAVVQRLVIFGDNDSKFGGQKSAYTLAHRLHRELVVEVKIPTEPGTDWLDVLNDGAGARAA
jgi:putative DNA primase/helicase